MSTLNRGIFFIIVGFLNPVIFLIGGGVVSSTFGHHWTNVFGASMVFGWTFIGPWIYLSAKKAPTKVNIEAPKTTRSNSFKTHVWGILSMLCWLAFFRSKAFESNVVQHAFMIFMGLSQSLFLPLGFGYLRRAYREELVGKI